MTRGDIFLAPFLYADLAEAKRRPVCVVSGADFNLGPDLIVAMVTSRHRLLTAPGVGDVRLEDWKGAGLLAPSTVRTGRLQTIEASLLGVQLGSVSESDCLMMDVALKQVLELTG